MGASVAASPVRLERLDGGMFWRVVLATPKANIVDAAKIAELHAIFERAKGERILKALVIEGEGAHFSFGASIDEHMPGRCNAMLQCLHAMTRALLVCEVPCLAAVRGQCLGGGLEIVSLCHRVFASRDAKLGQPEIVLGVFAPVGSIALPERIGRAAAEDLLLTGRSVSAEEAFAQGLVDVIDDDPSAAALEYARKHLAPKSASSLRFAVRAARASFVERYTREIDRLERMYLDDLMQSQDAVEGLKAFTEKRTPNWRDA